MLEWLDVTGLFITLLNYLLSFFVFIFRKKHNFVLADKVIIRSNISALRYTIVAAVFRFIFCDFFFLLTLIIRYTMSDADISTYQVYVTNSYVSTVFDIVG